MKNKKLAQYSQKNPRQRQSYFQSKSLYLLAVETAVYHSTYLWPCARLSALLNCFRLPRKTITSQERETERESGVKRFSTQIPIQSPKGLRQTVWGDRKSTFNAIWWFTNWLKQPSPAKRQQLTHSAPLSCILFLRPEHVLQQQQQQPDEPSEWPKQDKTLQEIRFRFAFPCISLPSLLPAVCVLIDSSRRLVAVAPWQLIRLVR